MAPSGSSKKVANSLVSLSSAAILVVYAAGFMKTFEDARPTRSSHCDPRSRFGESIATEMVKIDASGDRLESRMVFARPCFSIKPEPKQPFGGITF